MKEDKLWFQDQAQAAGETQIHATEEPELLNTLQLIAVNYRGNLTNVQRENRAQQEEERQPLVSEEFLETETANIPVDELPQYFQHVKVIHNPTPRNASDNSLRMAVECNNLESLERLWSDYRSGHLNAVAEKCLVADDDIKRRFHVQSVNLNTNYSRRRLLGVQRVSLEEARFIQCKNNIINQSYFCTNSIENYERSPVAFGETETLATEETRIQSAEETRTLTVEDMGAQATEETQIQSAGEIETRAADESEATEETRTHIAEEMETRAMAESQVQCAEKTQTKAADKMETMATGKTKIPSPHEFRAKASETLVTEATQIQSRILQAFKETETQGVEEIRPQDTEETESLILDENYERSPVTTLATKGTLIQSSEETRTLTVGHLETQATAKVTQIQSAGEIQTQAVDESETTEETRTQTAEEMETRAMEKSQIQFSGETKTKAADERETLATKETQIPSQHEVQTQASETLVTEATQIQSRILQASEETETQAVEEIRPHDTEETESLILDDKVNITSIQALQDVSFLQIRDLSERKGDNQIEVKFIEQPSVVKDLFSPLHKVQESLTFHDLWTQCEKKAQTVRKNDEAKKRHISITDVVENVWKPALKDWNQHVASVMDGTITLEDVDKIFDRYKNRKKNLSKSYCACFH
ncbi:hypothetical protein OS493_005776 [Desmophyllum pertusum]|uniref:TRADD-like N-terminal domain-containing protein n=1 Tax=Desmophyllum pertusum TaxID=174260 RepID=A0A9X0CGI4_9CNID|nr:hypothetical protein OS493_005776 [Desmophyllum pertusum]